jgi:hypothetical protein
VIVVWKIIAKKYCLIEIAELLGCLTLNMQVATAATLFSKCQGQDQIAGYGVKT